MKRCFQTLFILLAGAPLFATGCAHTLTDPGMIQLSDIPRELQKVSHPVYRVAPPDLLTIEAVNNIRLADDRLRAGDELTIQLGNPEPLAPPPPNAGPTEAQLMVSYEAQTKFIDGGFRIQTDGTVNLGPVYGSVHVADKTLAQAKDEIIRQLQSYTMDAMGRPAGIAEPKVAVSLLNIAGKQVITGEHLVRPDGTVALGVYDSVHVAGKTLTEVKDAVEQHLAQYLHDPEVSVDVAAYNSRVYYMVTDGGGYGEQVERFPCTGNETVLDAISNIQGLSQVSSKRIWVARPAPAGTTCAQVLDVNWREITREGITDTNYQLLPGDRVYIAADKMIAADNFIGKVIAPVERIMGVILLGSGVQSTLRFIHVNNRGGGGGGN